MTGPKKLLFAFLIAALGITQVIPAAVFAEEKVNQDSATATEVVESAEAMQKTQEESKNEKKVVKTDIKGLDKENKFLIYSKTKVSDTIKVNHGVGRKVYLEKQVKGKWVVKKTYTAAKGDKSKTINVDYTASCKKDKVAKYRIRIPAKTVNKTVKSNGEVVKKTTVYKQKIQTTKTVGEKFAWPLPGKRRISSGFGGRMCPFHGREFHPGIDIPARTGTKVRAAADGVVLKAGRVRSFGKRIIIKHGNKKTTTWYNHLSSIKVKKGQTIKRGQVIGRVGSTGDSTGSHLDFRIFINGKAKNPLKYAKRK